MSNSEQQDARQSIISKSRASLLDKLEKVSVEANKTQFQVWANQEAKKVEDLEKKNSELKLPVVKTALTKKKSRKK